jgi:hypothetical protein
MNINSFEHKAIIKEIQTKKHYQDLMYKNFLTGLTNAPFDIIKFRMINNTLNAFWPSNSKNSKEE